MGKIINCWLWVTCFLGINFIIINSGEEAVKIAIIKSDWWHLINVITTIILTFTLLYFHKQLNKEEQS